MKKLVIAVLLFNSFSVYSSAESVNTSVTDDKIFKIPAHVFIFENLFFPGAGHVYNDHLKLAAFNFFTTISALGGYFGNASSHDSYNELPAYPTMHDVNLNSGQECFLANRQARHDKDFANSLLLMAVISYIDGFVESYYAANKGWGDDLNFSVGGGGMFSGIRTLAIVNEGSQIARGQDAQTGGGVTFAIRHGRLLEKDVIAHFGPHAIITYDMTYYLRLNRWAFLSLGNQFDFQRKIYNYSGNFLWTSYDKYQVITDNIVFGGRVRPLMWLSMDLGIGLFNIATLWHSFADNQYDPYFSQKHAGRRGSLTNTYLAAKMNADIGKNLFVSGRFKYLSSREPEPNYDATVSFIDFFRIEAYLGYSF